MAETAILFVTFKMLSDDMRLIWRQRTVIMCTMYFSEAVIRDFGRKSHTLLW